MNQQMDRTVGKRQEIAVESLAEESRWVPVLGVRVLPVPV